MQNVVHLVAHHRLDGPSHVRDDGLKPGVVKPFFFDDESIFVEVEIAMGARLTKHPLVALIDLLHGHLKARLDDLSVLVGQDLCHGNDLVGGDVQFAVSLGDDQHHQQTGLPNDDVRLKLVELVQVMFNREEKVKEGKANELRLHRCVQLAVGP